MNFNINRIVYFVLFISLGLYTVDAQAQRKSKRKMKIENQKDSISYSLGVSIGKNIQQQGFTDINVEAMNQALMDVYGDNELQISEEEANQFLNTYFQKVQQEKFEAMKQEGEQFLAENAKRSEVVTLESGLQYEVMKSGSGASPKLTDKVTTHYHGTFINGQVFDSSVARNQPASFPVNGVIAGWTEALQLMKVGDKWRLFVPYTLAYGERGAGESIPPYAALIFEVELLSID